MSAHSDPLNPEGGVDPITPLQQMQLDAPAAKLMQEALAITRRHAERGAICPACANVQAMNLAVQAIMSTAPDTEDGMHGLAEGAGTLLGALVAKAGPEGIATFTHYFNRGMAVGAQHADLLVTERPDPN